MYQGENMESKTWQTEMAVTEAVHHPGEMVRT